jgi:hypothetical protein
MLAVIKEAKTKVLVQKDKTGSITVLPSCRR